MAQCYYDAGKRYFDSGKPIVIRRKDVKKVQEYARAQATLRDYLIVRLPIKIGLRTSEIASLRIEDIDFDARSFQVLDSKKKRRYPLPLDVLTLQLIQDLIGSNKSGYVFTHETWKHRRRGQPLTRLTVWVRTSRTAHKAGVEGYSPRVGRHYFAANWAFVEKKSMEGLRRILRHKNLAVTTAYLAKLFVFEDLQVEYEQTQNPYLEPASSRGAKPLPPESHKTDFYREWCSHCDHEPICKIMDQMCASPGATGCKFYIPKQQASLNTVHGEKRFG